MKVWAYITRWDNKYYAKCFAAEGDFDCTKAHDNCADNEVEAKANLLKNLPENVEVIWFDSNKDFREGDCVIFENITYVFGYYTEGNKAKILKWWSGKVITVNVDKIFAYYVKRLWQG